MIPVSRAYRPHQMVMGRFDKGSDIIESLEKFAAENNIAIGWVQLIGALSEVELSYYDQDSHKYQNKKFEGHFEIISGTGNVSSLDGKPMAHVHMMLANDEYQPIAGHLTRGGTKVLACEFCLWQVLDGTDNALVRKYDEATGLSLWER